MHFQTRCRLKFFSPISSHVNENEKKNGKNAKFEISPNLYNLVETLPRSMHNLGSESGTYFQRRCRFIFFLPHGSMLTKRKKKS